MKVELGPNEFTIQDDRVGFIDDGGKLEEFLTIDHFTDTTLVQDPFKAVRFNPEA